MEMRIKNRVGKMQRKGGREPKAMRQDTAAAGRFGEVDVTHGSC